ncbi:alpha/beta hydrolase [Nesterenkonia sp. HG001]|uniref:alpha/beta hydrolase n=1 Tax=Nesterenkonia sp. HG001 TaxID=2983207 RepID=UPI002AC43120|nr:alpha/beta fold hydrolase [Nesterenkonia sp. HG001]MDZ5078605.1 alpha/beta fold hydrolase [Nesterenkonia sp. HG001]
MRRLHHPAPETFRTPSGLTAHLWRGADAARAPVVLIHGYGSNVLFNWVKTGWLEPLAKHGRSILAVDLPGHGTSAEVDPAGVRAEDLLVDLRTLLVDHLQAGVSTAPVTVHGYSLGSRLAWQFAAANPELVALLVMGGSPASDRLFGLDSDAARRWAREGTPPRDGLTRAVVTVAAAMPDQNLPHVVELLLSLAQEPFDFAAAVPAVPTLVVAGEKDEIAVGASHLAQLVRRAGAAARFVEIPGRTHVNVLTSRIYKDSVLDALP